MDQTAARQRARQYHALGYIARATTQGGWPKADEPWHVEIQAVNKEFYQEFDVRVTEARNRWTRQYAVKPDQKCRCGYDPHTQQGLDDHIEVASRIEGQASHGPVSR